MSSAIFINLFSALLIMGYKAAFELADFAKKYGILGNYRVQRYLTAIAHSDDPDLQASAEEYIGMRALRKLVTAQRWNR
jgi:hypothetical protein